MPRKQQFSNKQKKQQLQEKRKRKQNQPDKFGFDSDEEKQKKEESGVTEDVARDVDEIRLNVQPVGTTHERVNKYSLMFGRETKEEIDQNVKQSKEPLPKLDATLLESRVEDFAVTSPDLGMPKRGKWSYSMSKQKLELAEQKEFKEWCFKLDEYYGNLGRGSYYERNLETWRQLWRTLEMSDVILFVCDIRYPTLHFSPSVYKYITEELDKQVILVLNKVDMVHPSVSVSWKRYFEQNFPEIRVVLFSAFPEEQKLVENTGRRLLKKQTIRKPGWAYGADSLIQLAKSHYEKKKKSNEVTPTVSEKPGVGQESESKVESESEKVESGNEKVESGNEKVESEDKKVESGSEEEFVTIGLIGQPNAGKSSLINGILQDKKVSVSKTPGHTKHFQTIFYSPGIRLCDCPGLVFPTIAPKQIQIVSGMYPVAQVREPYSVVGYVAERIDLVSYLRLTHPCLEDEPDAPWSAWYICFAWADKNGYHTARTGRPDVYRGANSILRLVVTGRLCVRLVPPEFSPDTVEKSYGDLLQELISFASKEEESGGSEVDYSEESSEEEEEMEKDRKTGNKFSLLQVDD
ncbi:hypothetical protein ACHWQZ_G005265 [Mnemiopsis leidyi]